MHTRKSQRLQGVKMKKWMIVTGIATFVIAIAISFSGNFGGSDSSNISGSSNSMKKVMVGGDIHTLTVMNNVFEISGHQNTSLSSDFGMSWKSISELNDADIMAWGVSGSTTFAGGHSGMFVKTAGGSKFKEISFYRGITDIHAIGASGKYVYVASPDIGFLASSDGGNTWSSVTTEVGKGFMGSMLVDPSNPLRVLAPDMQLGLLETLDGGKSWKALGGPMGTMSIAWNPQDISEIAVLGMGSAQISSDAGKTWNSFALPANTLVITYSENGKTLYAATQDEVPNALIYQSNDLGTSWSLLGNDQKAAVVTTSEMDPNMPGMDHSTNDEAAGSTDRPLALTLSIFGFIALMVMLGGFFMRQSDRMKADEKKEKLHKVGAGQ
jgi:photosystem II stability/assembly factor-like uncharacterized protein